LSIGGGNMLAQIPAEYSGSNPSAASLARGDFPQPLKTSAARILVVDDELLVRWSIAETLRPHGFEIIEAASAREALDAVSGASRSPDAVILDVKLPDNDDLRLFTSLRTLLPKVPVILMTAFSTPELLSDARRLGAFAILDKPFELEQLDAELARALAARRAH
jgi:DNA-binding NtrC family response regulator